MPSERGARRARAGRAAGADARSAAPFARHAPPTASRLQNQIQNDLVALQKRLAQVNAAIQRKEASREEYDKTIVETQAAYMKVRPRPSCARASERSDWEGAEARAARACVRRRRPGWCAHDRTVPPWRLTRRRRPRAPQILESSQTLLNVLKRESAHIQKKKQDA